MDFNLILSEIKGFSSQELDIAEMEDSTIFVSRNFIEIWKQPGISSEDAVFEELVLECIKHLKIMCTKGPSFQKLIVNTTGMLQTLRDIVSHEGNKFSSVSQLKCFQLVANLCVKNPCTQQKIWAEMSELVTSQLRNKDFQFVNVASMIVYNMILSKQPALDIGATIKITLNLYQNFLKEPTSSLPDFLHIMMDHVICRSPEGSEVYKNLSPADQKICLYYIHDYVEEEANDIINEQLLHHLTVEFKRTSDCILKTVSDYVEAIDPQIVVSLLDIISIATSQEKYNTILKSDRSLFLNLGCLLQALHKIGKASDSMFTPIQSLDALAPTSNVNSDFEKEISFSFKTKLVQALANLAHRNKKNQELAREMEILMSIFECTNADARNPLIREWSILAIRNLCENNPENQEIVRQLTKVGDAENPVLKEMGFESGTLRIGKQ